MAGYKGTASVHSPAGDIGEGFGSSEGRSTPAATIHSPADDLTGRGFSMSPTQTEFGDSYGMPGPERAGTDDMQMVQQVTGLPSSPSGTIGSTDMADGLSNSPKP